MSTSTRTGPPQSGPKDVKTVLSVEYMTTFVCVPVTANVQIVPAPGASLRLRVKTIVVANVTTNPATILFREGSHVGEIKVVVRVLPNDTKLVNLVGSNWELPIDTSVYGEVQGTAPSLYVTVGYTTV